MSVQKAKKIQTIGITGRSGSGKSFVADYFAQKSYPVADGDLISRELIIKGSACLAQLVQAFGRQILHEDESLNRKKLGKLAFANAEGTKLLNSITHPHIMQAFLEKKAVAEKSGAKMFFLDGAAIIGGIFHPYCDKMIVVTVLHEVAVKRIMARDGLAREDAEARLGAQTPEKILLASADYVLENSGEKQELVLQADELLIKLLSK